MRNRIAAFCLSLLLICLLPFSFVNAQTDTLRVMAYNVLYYGANPHCQGPISTYHNYLKQIVAFANPDIIGLEKMGSIPTSPSDFTATAPKGFGDSVLQYALNAAFADRYAYCPFTNATQADNVSLLFYNKQKLGFVAITSSYERITDFNTYKLYYKDPNLSTTHDTTFLYITLNHDQSGSESIRDTQIANEMVHIKNHFIHLPNMINMGDFNTHSSNEGCYQVLVAPADTNFKFYDPPFFPDMALSYPINWDASPNLCPAFLTTSTRQSASIPNTCGTSGGAKSWYDHIFLSQWIVHNANYISYMPHSYRTLGNDGHRLGISENDSSVIRNTSVPSNVVNAIFQMSNKYPVMVDLLVTSNTTGTSPADPEIYSAAVTNVPSQNEDVSFTNPVQSQLQIHFTNDLLGQKVNVVCYDMLGKIVMQNKLVVDHSWVMLPCNLQKGVYVIRIYTKHNMLCNSTLVKQ